MNFTTHFFMFLSHLWFMGPLSSCWEWIRIRFLLFVKYTVIMMLDEASPLPCVNYEFPRIFYRYLLIHTQTIILLAWRFEVALQTVALLPAIFMVQLVIPRKINGEKWIKEFSNLVTHGWCSRKSCMFSDWGFDMRRELTIEIEENSLTLLPLRCMHGSMHPDWKGRFHHSDPHVTKRDRP